ncbi:MAG: PKD domain-containing protein, partial [Ferruginibacter sp.]
WQPENLIATGVLGDDGCIPPYLNAQIKTDNAVFCSGKTIQFSNPTAGNTATSYQWTFAGGNPTVSSANNVTVNYAQPGNYKVFLTVSNGSIKRTDSLLITVSDCKPDSSTLSMAHWYFGNFGSIDFSSGVPIQTTTALTNHSIQGELAYPTQNGPYIKSTISLSDSLGNLLFYSNAVSVWNKNHEKITSAPIFGVSDINASSGYCYIPFPGKKGKYFAAGVYPNFDESPSGVRFVLVDVDSNRVSPYKEFKNIALPKRFSEFLTVVPHCNGMDYWIIVKGFQSDTKFYSFLVTDSGIDALQTPVISSGFSHPGYGGDGNQLKSNRAGDKLILCSPHGNLNIETGVIYDFDNGTGLISNERIIPNIPAYSNIQGGGAFSPNGKYFYLMRSSNFATNGLPYWLFQYRTDDMSYNVFPAPGFYFAASFQQGPDGNIYITTQDNKVARISNPDEWGAISFDGSFLNMMQLNPDIRTGVSIPSFIDARRPDPKHPDFNYKTVSCNTFQFNAKCFDNYTSTWNFGDGSGTETGGLINHNFKNP